MLCVINLSLIFRNVSCGIYSILYNCISFNKYETQCIPLVIVLLRFMIYAPSFILGKSFLEKTPLNVDS